MKAWVHREYGGPEVVPLEEVPTPVQKDDEIVIKVFATTVTAADWRARTLEMAKGFGSIGRLIFGLRRPRRAALGSRKMIAGVAPESRVIAERLAQLATEGVLRPFIDERYEFSQMPEAHARVASRRKRGNVVVLVSHDDAPCPSIGAVEQVGPADAPPAGG